MATGFKQRAGRAVGRQLAHPRGLAGQMLGRMMRVANRRPVAATVDALELQPGDQVLDIGCGDGSALALMGIAGRVTGIDRSATMIAAAKRRHRAALRSGRMALVEGDMMALPFAPGSFNKFAAINMLYFCDDVPRFIASIRRIAQPGATLAIYVTAAESMRDWAFASAASHRHFTRQQLQDEIARADIKRCDCRVMEIQLPGGIIGMVATVRIDPDD